MVKKWSLLHQHLLPSESDEVEAAHDNGNDAFDISEEQVV